MKKRFEEEGFEVRNHPAGYRSVHYVIESSPVKRKIITEIQVRTIFEEGWSEIDHKVRYPNFSDNDLIRCFLEIFNRMAGSADDMGAFVQGLVATLGSLEKTIIDSKNDKETIYKEMELAFSQLENVKVQGEISKASVAKLKAEIEKLKGANNAGINSLLGSSDTRYIGLGLMSLHPAVAANLGLMSITENKPSIPGLMSSTEKDRINGILNIKK